MDEGGVISVERWRVLETLALSRALGWWSASEGMPNIIINDSLNSAIRRQRYLEPHFPFSAMDVTLIVPPNAPRPLPTPWRPMHEIGAAGCLSVFAVEETGDTRLEWTPYDIKPDDVWYPSRNPWGSMEFRDCEWDPVLTAPKIMSEWQGYTKLKLSRPQRCRTCIATLAASASAIYPDITEIVEACAVSTEINCWKALRRSTDDDDSDDDITNSTKRRRLLPNGASAVDVPERSSAGVWDIVALAWAQTIDNGRAKTEGRSWLSFSLLGREPVRGLLYWKHDEEICVDILGGSTLTLDSSNAAAKALGRQPQKDLLAFVLAPTLASCMANPCATVVLESRLTIPSTKFSGWTLYNKKLQYALLSLDDLIDDLSKEQKLLKTLTRAAIAEYTMAALAPGAPLGWDCDCMSCRATHNITSVDDKRPVCTHVHVKQCFATTAITEYVHNVRFCNCKHARSTVLIDNTIVAQEPCSTCRALCRKTLRDVLFENISVVSGVTAAKPMHQPDAVRCDLEGVEDLVAEKYCPVALARWLPPCLRRLATEAASIAHPKFAARQLYAAFYTSFLGLGDDSGRYMEAMRTLLGTMPGKEEVRLATSSATAFEHSTLGKDTTAVWENKDGLRNTGCRHACRSGLCPLSDSADLYRVANEFASDTERQTLSRDTINNVIQMAFGRYPVDEHRRCMSICAQLSFLWHAKCAANCANPRCGWSPATFYANARASNMNNASNAGNK